MTYEMKQDFISYNRPGTPLTPIGIIDHDTDDPGATDEGEHNYFNTGNRNASAHYFVDWDSITQFIPDNEQAWHAWSYANAHFLSIELCIPGETDPDRENKAQEAYKRYVWLNAYLCNKYHWEPDTDVHSHKWVSDNYQGDHQDPIPYFTSRGLTWDKHIQNIQDALNALKEPVKPCDLYRIVTADALNGRTGPDVSYPVRYVLKKGLKIHLSQLTDNWAFTTYGALGAWVSRKFLAEPPKTYKVSATDEAGSTQDLGTADETKLDQIKNVLKGV